MYVQEILYIYFQNNKSPQGGAMHLSMYVCGSFSAESHTVMFHHCQASSKCIIIILSDIVLGIRHKIRHS